MTQIDNAANSLAGGAASPLSPFHVQDLASAKSLLDQINVSASTVANTLSTGFVNAAASGKSFNDALATIGDSLARLMLRAGAQTLANGLVNAIGAMFTSSFSANGEQAITPFADGGVVAAPAFFGANSSIGLMGERGAEAILPLARGPDGRLGVAAQGDARPVNVTVNVTANDAESFKRSEAQIMGALARAVARGQRAL